MRWSGFWPKRKSWLNGMHQLLAVVAVAQVRLLGLFGYHGAGVGPVRCGGPLPSLALCWCYRLAIRLMRLGVSAALFSQRPL